MGRLAKDLKIYDRELSSVNLDLKDDEESCCNRSWCWWNPPQESILAEYFQDTYLHGLKFAAQPSRHLIERIFWIAAFIAGIVIAGSLISDVWRKYKTSPVILAFDPHDLSISEIQFPAVTVCNINKVQRKFAEEVQKKLKAGDTEAQQDYYVMNSVCTSNPSFAKRIPEGKKLFFNEELMKPPPNNSVNYVADFLHRASQPCTEMLQRCSWSGVVIDCDKLFFPVITELGICCTFNLMPLSLLLKFPSTFEAKPSSNQENENMKVEKGKWEKVLSLPYEAGNKLDRPRRQYVAGQTHGLSLLLYPDLDNYFCTAADSSGFRVALHSAIETPHVTEFGMAVPSGADIYVEIYPEVTTAEGIVTKFPVSDRHCYFQKEKELKYYNHYTQMNCLDECESDWHRERCNCSWFYEPRDTGTMVCVPNNATSNCSAAYKENERCLNQKCSHCLPLCTQIKFGIQSSLSALLNYTTLWKSMEEVEPKLTNQPWIGKPVTILNLYYGDDNVVPKQRKELYGSTDLFANTGGLLGLCLGFSGLSAVEILYFFTIRLWFRKNGARPSLGRRIKWRFKRFCRRLTGRRSHNVRVTLKKQEIPFWPKGKPGVEVNHIQVQNGVKSTNSLLSGIPEYPAI